MILDPKDYKISRLIENIRDLGITLRNLMKSASIFSTLHHF